jgi:hypothetical protein
MAGSSGSRLVPSVSRSRRARGSVMPAKKLLQLAKSAYRAVQHDNELGCPLISQLASAMGRSRHWPSDNPDRHRNGGRSMNTARQRSA